MFVEAPSQPATLPPPHRDALREAPLLPAVMEGLMVRRDAAGRRASGAEAPGMPAAPPVPTVEIHIGRIEVRAVAPARPERPARSAPPLSLDDYLKGVQP